MTEWKEYKLKEIAQLEKDSWKVGDEKLPYIALEHIVEGGLRLQGIGDSNTIASNKFRFNSDCFLFGKLRPYFRKLFRPNFEGICSTDIWVVKPRGENDKDFLFYFFANQDFVDFTYSGSSGTRMPRADWNFVSESKWNFPPLPEQKAIASVLSSLDDKIDLLHRQNKTLEAMAETLFRQWFVEEADEGWEEVPLGNSDLAKIIKSGINYFEGEKIYLATGDVNNTDIRGGTPITFNDKPSRANMEPVIYSVWFAKKGGVRKALMFDDYSYNLNNLILSTGFTGLKTTKLSHYYIWCYIMSTEFQEIKDSFVSGTVQPDINNEGVNQIMISKPDNETLLNFNKNVKELFFKISFNQSQIRTLEKLRDTLLPKLMSGKVRVKMEE
ncbi:MAG: type restriction enzyme subunit [Candidatus Cloacimonadota bacterium]|nr:type restriction enzyme subunit [Candidatus Cloacimonadota bacterium]